MKKHTPNRLFYSLIFLLSLMLLAGCTSNDEPSSADCSGSDLAVSITLLTNPTSCDAPNGIITVSGTGGGGGYTYSLNNSTTFQASGTFSSLASGTYTVTVKDQRGCTKTETNIVLASPDSPAASVSSSTPDTSCNSDDGSLTILATGGTGIKQYSLNGTSFQASNIFSNLRAGNYTVTVKDEGNCSVQVSATVANATGITYSGSVLAVFQSNCLLAGCHLNNANGRGNWGVFAEAKAKADLIKARTQAGTMPPSGALPQAERDLIACWVDHGSPEN